VNLLLISAQGNWRPGFDFRTCWRSWRSLPSKASQTCGNVHCPAPTHTVMTRTMYVTTDACCGLSCVHSLQLGLFLYISPVPSSPYSNLWILPSPL